MPPHAAPGLCEAKGYVEAGREVSLGHQAGGTFEHAEAHENKDPFELPAIWKERKGKAQSLDAIQLYQHG